MISSSLVSWKAFLAGVLVGCILSGILVLLIPLRSPGPRLQSIPIELDQKEKNVSLDSDLIDPGAESVEGTNSNEGKININAAGIEELVTLPGIGEAKAKAIIAYREDYGYFQEIQELLFVPGIGENLFSGLSDLIYVDN